MRIPKSFSIGPHEIQVHVISAKEMEKVTKQYYPESVEDDEIDWTPWGLFTPGTQQMYIQETSDCFSKQRQLQVFWHECFHALFFALNLECANDEVMVDQCGLLMLQLQQSMKF